MRLFKWLFGRDFIKELVTLALEEALRNSRTEVSERWPEGAENAAANAVLDLIADRLKDEINKRV